jgi:hypothetical protein
VTLGTHLLNDRLGWKPAIRWSGPMELMRQGSDPDQFKF